MKIPTKKVKRRDEKLLEYCKWKKVLHIWASDSPYTVQKFNGQMGAFLYREIDKVCAEQVGVDLDQASVDFLNSKKEELTSSRSICLDMNQFWDLDYEPDVIIFGEVIEHLMNLETALTNLKKVMKKDTLLIISTPNCFSFDAIIANLLGYELFHPDHKVYFSHRMLTHLLKFNWLKTVDTYFCKLAHEPENFPAKVFSFLGDYVVYYIFPRFYNNLLFVAKLQ